jgi:hypothetical protein
MAPELDKPLVHLPPIPAEILQRHRVYIPLDTRFRSAARLSQALYREEHKLPIGTYFAEDGHRHKLGSRIAWKAGNAGANFLSEKIFYTARRELMYCEIGSFIDAERLACNLLTSMPLVFNLFAPMARYCDWWKVDREIEKHAPTFGLSKRTRKKTPEWP